MSRCPPPPFRRRRTSFLYTDELAKVGVIGACGGQLMIKLHSGTVQPNLSVLLLAAHARGKHMHATTTLLVHISVRYVLVVVTVQVQERQTLRWW